jgi:Flp pilus assembly protein TadD
MLTPFIQHLRILPAARPGAACAAPVVLAAALACGGCGARPSYERIMEEGMHEYDIGNYADAIGMFRQAAEADKERPEPAYHTGRCYLAMADREFKQDDLPAALRYCDRAVDAFGRAVAAFPGYSRALQAQADSMKLKGRNEAALVLADWASKHVGPQAKMHIFKGRQYAQAGDLDGAQLAFKQAASMEEHNPAAHTELGLFYMRCGNETEARRSLQRAYDLSPGDPTVLAALAKLGVSTGQTP